MISPSWAGRWQRAAACPFRTEPASDRRCCRNVAGGCLLTCRHAKTRIHLPLQDTNWYAYNLALVRLGQLTLWFDEAAVAAWRDTAGSSGPGRPKVYANAAIECALVLKSVFHLSLQATQGFLESVVALMGLELPVPDYSTMSRRQAVFGGKLWARTFENQQVEAAIKCAVLNRMTGLGCLKL